MKLSSECVGLLIVLVLLFPRRPNAPTLLAKDIRFNKVCRGAAMLHISQEYLILYSMVLAVLLNPEPTS